MLDMALSNIKRLDVVGITEDLNRMILQLKYHLDHLVYPGFEAWPSANEISSQKKSTLDEQSLQIMLNWSWADQELYKAAVQLEREKMFTVEHCSEHQ